MNTGNSFYSRYKKYSLDIRQFAEKPVARATLAISLTLVMTGIFLAFALRPTFMKIAELKREIEEAEKTLDTLKKKTESMQRVAKVWEDVKTNLPYIDQGVPISPDYRTFVKEIEVLGIRNEVVLTSVNLGPSLVSSQILKPYEKKVATEGIELPLMIQITGEYQQIKKFIQELSLLDRIVAIESITMAPNATENTQAEGAVPMGPMNLQVSGKAYYFGDAKQLKNVLGIEEKK